MSDDAALRTCPKPAARTPSPVIRSHEALGGLLRQSISSHAYIVQSAAKLHLPVHRQLVISDQTSPELTGHQRPSSIMQSACEEGSSSSIGVAGSCHIGRVSSERPCRCIAAAGQLEDRPRQKPTNVVVRRFQWAANLDCRPPPINKHLASNYSQSPAWVSRLKTGNVAAHDMCNSTQGTLLNPHSQIFFHKSTNRHPGRTQNLIPHLRQACTTAAIIARWWVRLSVLQYNLIIEWLSGEAGAYNGFVACSRQTFRNSLRKCV